MRRRRFLTGSGAALAATFVRGLASAGPAAEGLIRPKALRAGAIVGLITPGTAVSDPDRLALAARTLKFFGLRMRMGKNVGRRSSDFGSSIDERLDDLHAMFRDPEVDAVFCVRGGYGSAHLLDRIDYDLLRRNPKIFLGYSDITVLHLAIHKLARLVTFHGPVMISSFTNYTQQYFRKALFETQPIGRAGNPPVTNELRPSHPLRTIRPGRASGPLRERTGASVVPSDHARAPTGSSTSSPRAFNL